MIIKQLKPDEFSEDRQKAMREIYGENWKQKLQSQFQEIELKITNKEKLDKVADYVVELVNTFIDDDKYKNRVISRAYHKCKEQISSRFETSTKD